MVDTLLVFIMDEENIGDTFEYDIFLNIGEEAYLDGKYHLFYHG